MGAGALGSWYIGVEALGWQCVGVDTLGLLGAIMDAAKRGFMGTRALGLHDIVVESLG